METDVTRSGMGLAGAVVFVAALGRLLTPGAALAGDAGTVVAVEGVAEIGRAGTWETALPGAAIAVGDEIRTGQPGAVRIVFADESVLSLGDGAHLVVDEQVFQPESGLFQSGMRLLGGKVRALVGHYYGAPGASFEVETRTAVAGVRGTEFVVAYDPGSEVTEVVVLDGVVEVHGSRDRLARGVFVRSGEATAVEGGQVPQPPRPIDPRDQWRYLEGLNVISLGSRGLAATSPLVLQQVVPEPDRAPAPVAGVESKEREARRRRDPSSLLGQPPAALERAAGGARVRF